MLQLSRSILKKQNEYITDAYANITSGPNCDASGDHVDMFVDIA